ncbi:MAG: SHOCT domain-containing protein, partial [Acidimicrobiia bacterium]
AAEEDKYAKLKEAKELLDAGILTEEEFAAEKAKILG